MESRTETINDEAENHSRKSIIATGDKTTTEGKEGATNDNIRSCNGMKGSWEWCQIWKGKPRPASDVSIDDSECLCECASR